MKNSLQQHGIKEVEKQLRLRMKNDGLNTVKVEVLRGSGKHKINFTGSAEQVAKARAVLANWS